MTLEIPFVENYGGDRRWQTRATVDLTDTGEVELCIGFQEREFAWVDPSKVSGREFPTEVDRLLHPVEARALAAALVHYAEEAER